eukprot:396636-Amphidinium_carterae.1
MVCSAHQITPAQPRLIRHQQDERQRQIEDPFASPTRVTMSVCTLAMAFVFVFMDSALMKAVPPSTRFLPH